MSELGGGGETGGGGEVPANDNVAPGGEGGEGGEHADIGARGPSQESAGTAQAVNDDLPPQQAANDNLPRQGGTGDEDSTAQTSAVDAQRHEAARRAGLRDVAANHPEDYVPSDAPPPQVDRPHQSPETWIDQINPGNEDPARRNNCGECARATQSTWQGEPAVAAATRDPGSGGELDAVMFEATGTESTPTSIEEVGARLAELGPGSSAIVGVTWQGEEGRGHWFNAVNDAGTVKALDGQYGLVEDWPPSRTGVGYDASEMDTVGAIFFDASGRVVDRAGK